MKWLHIIIKYVNNWFYIYIHKEQNVDNDADDEVDDDDGDWLLCVTKTGFKCHGFKSE